MTVYKISNTNGRLDHVVSKKAAVARANEIEGFSGTENLTVEELEKDYNWSFKKCSPAYARSVGL